jgi:hypothetical protein
MERINHDYFFDTAPIDWIGWIMWHERKPRKPIVRIAWKGGPGWQTLIDIYKPFWLRNQELDEKVRRDWAKQMDAAKKKD